MNRKIIQISTDNCKPQFGQPIFGIYALCDDGSLWNGTWSNGNMEWTEVNIDKIKEKA